MGAARSIVGRSSAAREHPAMKPAFVLAAVLVPLLIGAAVLSVWVWGRIGDTPIGPQGYVALGLGVVATLGIGGGLMWLLFFSTPHCYDHRARRDPAADYGTPPARGSAPAPRGRGARRPQRQQCVQRRQQQR